MNTRWVPLVLLLTSLCFVLSSRTPALAGLSMVQTQRFFVAESEVLDQEIWLLAEDIQFDGTTQQPFLAITGAASLNGSFQKETWILGTNIIWNGQAHESVRLAAQKSVHFYGTTSNNLAAAGATSILIGETGVIHGDALLAAPTVVMLGRVNGSAYVWAREVTIGGHILQSLHLRASDIVIRPGTRIEGNLYYAAPRDLALPRDAIVTGEIKRIPLPVSEKSSANWALQFFFFMAAMLAGLAFLSLYPRLVEAAVLRVRTQLWKTALVGGVALFAIPVTALALFLILVGIPLGLLLLVWYATALYLAKIIIALAIAGLIFQREQLAPRPLAALILAAGLLLLYVASALPFIGPVVTMLIIIIGMGGLLLGVKDVQFGKPDTTDLKPDRPVDTFNDPWIRRP